MPSLRLYNVGDTVQLLGLPVVGKIVSIGVGTVSVDTFTLSGASQGRTTWSPDTQVVLYIPPKPPSPVEAAPSQPTEPVVTPMFWRDKAKAKTAKEKPKTEKAPTPKEQPEVDYFGVRTGSMASLCNDYILKKQTDVTVEDILANVKGSKRDNVRSHLKRMIRDKLITNKGTDKDLKVSVPKKKPTLPKKTKKKV